MPHSNTSSSGNYLKEDSKRLLVTIAIVAVAIAGIFWLEEKTHFIIRLFGL